MRDGGDKVSLRHIAEVYLYEYYIAGDRAYETDSGERLADHLQKGQQLMESMEFDSALQEWLSALDCDPVCMEAFSGIISCYKNLYDMEKEYEYTIRSYDYCCTRAELAAFYRNLGWYYLEKYHPLAAVACYKYSNLFMRTEQAQKEIAFLEKAVKKSYKDMETGQIQEILTEKEIPLKANPLTLALLYKAGCEAYDTGNKEQAYDCFCMVYDLTQDEEVRQRMEQIK